MANAIERRIARAEAMANATVCDAQTRALLAMLSDAELETVLAFKETGIMSAEVIAIGERVERHFRGTDDEH
ncbi:hypothetical+protein [Methylocapsa aurea]|uniref:hypothetical protein n=1 Tax=Methylocapsa aurea TaxID=663610 RepID=UPI003D18C173